MYRIRHFASHADRHAGRYFDNGACSTLKAANIAARDDCQDSPEGTEVHVVGPYGTTHLWRREGERAYRRTLGCRCFDV